MRIFIVLFASLMAVTTSAQGLLIDIVDGAVRNQELTYGSRDINGHPNLYDEYSTGKVITKEGATIDVEGINVDICSQKIIVEMDGKKIWLNDHLVEKAVIRDDTGAMNSFAQSNYKGEMVYLEVLEEGLYSLYRLQTKIIKEPSRTTNTYGAGDDLKAAHFKSKKAKHFLSYDGGELKEIKSSKKSFQKAVQREHQSSLKKMFKNKEVKIKSIEGLASALKLLNLSLAK